VLNEIIFPRADIYIRVPLT